MTQIEYAPGATLSRRRVRTAVTLTIVVATVLLCWRWGPAGMRHGQVWYWQRRCMQYSPSTNEVVYENDPVAAGKLLAIGGYVGEGAKPLGNVALRPAKCLDALLGLIGQQGLSHPGPAATLFMHELRTKSCERRLVILQGTAAGGGGMAFFYPVILDPKSLNRFTPPISYSGDLTVDGIEPGSHVRFFAGQVDPSDPSHFTVAFESDQGPGVIEGRLDSAGNHLTLQMAPTGLDETSNRTRMVSKFKVSPSASSVSSTSRGKTVLEKPARPSTAPTTWR